MYRERNFFLLLTASSLIYFAVLSWNHGKMFSIGRYKNGLTAYFLKGFGNEPIGMCSSKQKPDWDLRFEDENNTAWPWNENLKAFCKYFFYVQYPLYRRKSQLDCSSGYPRLVSSLTNSPSDVQVVQPGDKCLYDYIRHCCNDKGYQVPNVMHYVWYSNVDVGFVTMASFISVIRFLQPCLIIFHGPYIPKGEFWNFFISVFPYVVIVNQSLTMEVFGHQLKHKEHGSDIIRINALREYGGVYLDWDQLLVRSIEPLRKYNFTMSLETTTKIANSFVLAAPNATFLTHYYNSYKNYTGHKWVYNSMEIPYQLSEQYPNLINRLPYTGIRSKHERRIGGAMLGNSDWSANYGIHVYLRGFKRRNLLNMISMRYENTTVGAALRLVLLGKKNVCEN